MTDYYKIQGYCSNSALSKYNDSAFKVDATEAYRLGSLFDAVVTDPALINRLDNTITGTDYKFTDLEYKRALKMKANMLNNPIAKVIFEHSQTQTEYFTESLTGTFNNIQFGVPFKSRLDFDASKKMGLIADLKRTFAKTQMQFEKAFDFFSYDRQAYCYMRMTNVERMVFIGVSSQNDDVFIININKNDAKYLSGKEKFNRLAFKWWLVN